MIAIEGEMPIRALVKLLESAIEKPSEDCRGAGCALLLKMRRMRELGYGDFIVDLKAVKCGKGRYRRVEPRFADSAPYRAWGTQIESEFRDGYDARPS